MTQALSVFVPVMGVILGWAVARKLGIFTPATIYIWFMTVDLIVFLVIADQHLNKADFTFTAMPWPPFDTVVLPVVLLYGVLILVGWLSVLRLRRPATSNQFLEGLLNALPKVRRDFTFLVAAFLLVVLWMEVFHFWDIDKSLFWSNRQYLLLNDPRSAGIQTLAGRLIHFLLRPLGLVLSSAGAFFWVRGRRHTAALFFLASIYPLLFAVAQNSRWAPLYVAGGLAVLAFFGNIRRSLVPLISGGLFGFILFVKVLVGRNTPYQGLGGTLDVFRVILADLQLQRWGLGFFFNVFQGAQSLANSLLIAPRFPSLYALLSFSPTISAIDHFDQIMGASLVKISPFVPMNTYSEALFFGTPYFVFLLVVVIAWLRVMSKLFLRRDAIGIAFAVFAYWMTFYLSQYPVRNSMRLLYASLLIGLIVDRLLSKRREPEGEPLPLPAAPADGKAVEI